MKNTKLIIVFGISGVGKTTTCKQVVHNSEHIIHYSASYLLNILKRSYEVRTINTVMDDQYAIVELVKYCRMKAKKPLMLLDAHSLIWVNGHEFIIPKEIIKAMHPNGLIFLKAKGEIIYERRIFRGDKNIPSPEKIEKLQKMSLEAVQSYAEILACPLLIIDANHKFDLNEILKTIF